MYFLSLRPGTGLLLVLALFLGGCENSVDPYAGQAEPYSIYGTLSFKQDRHFIRVKPLQTPVSSLPTHPLPATVTLTNLSNGRTNLLQDSIIVFGEETVTHNYWTDLDIQPRTEYQLTVEGPEGTAQATTLTPTNTEAVVDPSGHTPGPPTDTIHISSSPDTLHCLTRFVVALREAKIPYEVSLGVIYNGQNIWISLENGITELGGGQRGITFVPNSLLERVDERIYDRSSTCLFREHRCQNLNTGRLRIAYTYLGPQWFGNRPPEDRGGFDPLRAGQLNGALGFFGGYFRDTLSVTMHRGVIELNPSACRGF